MIFFENSKTASFQLDNLEAVKQNIKRLGIECKVLTPSYASQYRGANEGSVIFKNEISKIEQNFLSN